jgi:hypothetical protein
VSYSGLDILNYFPACKVKLFSSRQGEKHMESPRGERGRETDSDGKRLGGWSGMEGQGKGEG